MSKGFSRAGVALFVALVALTAGPRPATAQAADAAARGAYLFALSGCAGCHTDSKNKGPLLAGGEPLKTPFGTFYGPNITPDPTHGIGKWSDADFVRALRDGVGPGCPGRRLLRRSCPGVGVRREPTP